MIKNTLTKKEAARKWVNGFNAIPLSLIQTLCKYDIDSIRELTPNYEEYYDFLPMWGTVWTFDELIDELWAEEHIKEISDCGFRIYENDDLGLFIGIDGAGYNFYDTHWIPLYEKRGLMWHNTREDTV